MSSAACRPVLAFSWLFHSPQAISCASPCLALENALLLKVALGHTVFRVSSVLFTALKPFPAFLFLQLCVPGLTRQPSLPCVRATPRLSVCADGPHLSRCRAHVPCGEPCCYFQGSKGLPVTCNVEVRLLRTLCEDSAPSGMHGISVRTCRQAFPRCAPPWLALGLP